MSKNVRMAILHIVVAAVCFIGALIFFNGRISMEKEVLWQNLPIRLIRSLK